MANFDEKSNTDKGEYFPRLFLGQRNHDDGQWHNDDGGNGGLLCDFHKSDPSDGTDNHEEGM